MLVLIPGAIESKRRHRVRMVRARSTCCATCRPSACRNTVAFTHIGNPEKQFPIARVFGTLGWIAAVTLVSKGLEAATKDPVMFQVAGYSSLAMGVLEPG